MNMTDIVATADAGEGFYPTPADVADKLLDGIDWTTIASVLEPSAGKGNLVMALARKTSAFKHSSRSFGSEYRLDVDVVEIDPYLRSILRYEFAGDREDELRRRLRELEAIKEYDPKTRSYGKLTPEQEDEKRLLTIERDMRASVDVHIVHDDFLTMDTRKHYDLIVMNPPFSDGDAHLLKALSLVEKTGGLVRCLLNAETIKNPYTNRRKVLATKLHDLGADVSFMDGAFTSAERMTGVSVAMVKIDVPAAKCESSIYERLKKAAEVEESEREAKDLAVEDFLGNIVARFNLEVDAGLALIDEYNGLCPYILEHISGNYNYPNLTLCVGDPGRRGSMSNPSRNKYIRLTRKKDWEALLSNEDFMAQMTSNIREKYLGMVGKMQDYDFSLFNIKQIMVEMNAELSKGIQETIVALFDKMTQEHSWYPETTKNIHYFNGWKTNKVHKINSKVILPTYGMFASYSWEGAFNIRKAEEKISDIEKVFDYLDGNMTAPVSLHGVLQAAHDEGRTKNIQCKYFSVTLYKKGTMHIKFSNQDLVDRFNIYCCRMKGWLPPSYGKARYSDMAAEEKAVVDGFHGDGSHGSGESAYGEIMARTDYYLAEPTNKMPSLMAAQE